MPRQAQIVDILLSSPSDVGDERQFVVDTARDWNSLRSKATGVFLNVLTWEDVVAPALSDRPQSVINDAVGDDYDAYLGIMWGRFGTPTGTAESGTVEEFENALERYRKGEGVRLAMLFKTNDIPQAQLNGAQFDKVQEFKKRYAAEGGFYGEFDSDDRLRRLLNRLFEDIASSQPQAPVPPPSPGPTTPKSGRKTRKDEPSASSEMTPANSRQNGPSDLSDIAEIGLFELNDRIVEVTGVQVKFFDDLTDIYLRSNEDISGANQELDNLVRFGQADESRIRPIVSKISGSLERTAEFLETRLPNFREKNDELVALTEQGFEIARDFGPESAHYSEFTKSVSDVVATLSQNKIAIDGMLETASALPRMSTQFNRAKKRLLIIARELRDEISHLYGRLESILNKYPNAPEVEAS